MHAAPSVSFPVGRSRFAASLLAALWLAGLAAAVAWWAQASAPGWRQALAFAAVAGCGLAALALWLRSAAGIVRWDGSGWSWEEGTQPGQAGHPELALDLQRHMLLRWVPVAAAGAPRRGRTRWLWVERNAAVSHWDALRRAVYSRATTAAPQTAQPPVAKR
jgi:hypothetical protein